MSAAPPSPNGEFVDTGVMSSSSPLSSPSSLKGLWDDLRAAASWKRFADFGFLLFDAERGGKVYLARRSLDSSSKGFVDLAVARFVAFLVCSLRGLVGS